MKQNQSKQQHYLKNFESLYKRSPVSSRGASPLQFFKPQDVETIVTQHPIRQNNTFSYQIHRAPRFFDYRQVACKRQLREDSEATVEEAKCQIHLKKATSQPSRLVDVKPGYTLNGYSRPRKCQKPLILSNDFIEVDPLLQNHPSDDCHPKDKSSQAQAALAGVKKKHVRSKFGSWDGSLRTLATVGNDIMEKLMGQLMEDTQQGQLLLTQVRSITRHASPITTSRQLDKLMSLSPQKPLLPPKDEANVSDCDDEMTPLQQAYLNLDVYPLVEIEASEDFQVEDQTSIRPKREGSPVMSEITPASNVFPFNKCGIDPNNTLKPFPQPIPKVCFQQPSENVEPNNMNRNPHRNTYLQRQRFGIETVMTQMIRRRSQEAQERVSKK
ncbi:hypothetical protein FGO68_gene16249 [Halteria grandinella]|uniref:Uncharacterized protein n=1 Tax=Halteria grandinella TaxID=5974 RepID=A0A8J8NP88_HALGN|nr:hypothetical protein FGO68_gene16249 [Halteria grandinella]